MSRLPLYERVEAVLAGDIADGSLPPETQLPPEEGLIEQFKVSRTTVRKAICGSRRNRRAPSCIATWDVGGQASACPLGRWCGDVF
jgi:DNA-binding transcriptional MocR family regulator